MGSVAATTVSRDVVQLTSWHGSWTITNKHISCDKCVDNIMHTGWW